MTPDELMKHRRVLGSYRTAAQLNQARWVFIICLLLLPAIVPGLILVGICSGAIGGFQSAIKWTSNRFNDAWGSQ